MTAKLQIVVIGLGKQSRDDHLPAIMQSENFELVGVCDTDQKKAEEIGTQYGVTGYADLGELINAQDFQVAVVSIPHHAYLNVISTLVTAGKHIIKEKPFQTVRQLNFFLANSTLCDELKIYSVFHWFFEQKNGKIKTRLG